jgi:hypothetical protein
MPRLTLVTVLLFLTTGPVLASDYSSARAAATVPAVPHSPVPKTIIDTTSTTGESSVESDSSSSLLSESGLADLSSPDVENPTSR